MTLNSTSFTSDNKPNREEKAQIRLLLPKDWVPELDALAASRFITRLSLIRFYLRKMMNDELAQLSTHFQNLQQHQATCTKIRNYLETLED